MELDSCVLDASVGIKLCVQEDLSDVAESLIATMSAKPHTHQYVPDLFFVECANVLWKYVIRHGYSRKDASRNLRGLYALNLVRIPTPTVIPAALEIALGHSISVYDACYIATADLVDAPLITADKRLVNSLVGTRHKPRYLGDIAGC
jgi:predicted nucleic acid-binding protein